MKKKILICLSIITVLFLSITIYLSIRFTNLINQNPLNLVKTVYSAYEKPSLSNSFNFLILGLDYRDDWLEKNQNTDTIIFASYNYQKNKVNLISLPRDLWYYQQKIKINKIYPDSLETNYSFSYIKEHFQNITSQKIDRILVLTTDNLKELVEVVNGVDVYLDNGFKDDKFPNPDYISNPASGVPVYKTIEFKTGWVRLDKNNVTDFVRSRKSSDNSADGGTDLGRIKRQQLLIDSLIKKLKSTEFLSNYQNLIKLYNFYQQKLQTDFTDIDIFSILFKQKEKIFNTQIQKNDIPICVSQTDCPIYEPGKLIEKQWVFLPSDKEYIKFKEFINSSIR